MSSAPATFIGVPFTGQSAQLVPRLEKMLLDSVALAVVEALPESKLAEFERVLQRADPAEVVAFVEANVPDAHDVIESEFADLHRDVALLAG